MRPARLWVIGSVVAVGVAYLALAFLNRPTIRAEYVGLWRGDLQRHHTIEFRADGTFQATSFEKRYRSDTDVTIHTSGTWRATPTSYCLTPIVREAKGLSNSVKEFDEETAAVVGRTIERPIQWIDADCWQPTDVGIGRFHRQRSP